MPKNTEKNNPKAELKTLFQGNMKAIARNQNLNDEILTNLITSVSKSLTTSITIIYQSMFT